MFQPEFSLPRTGPRRRTVMLLMANALDCDALGLWFQRRLEGMAVECSIDLAAGLDRSRSLRPSVLALDPEMAPEALEQATTALQRNWFDHLLVLDRRPSELRLSWILQEARASYISRKAAPEALAAAMSDILHNNVRAFDPSFAHRVQRTSKGYQLQNSDENSLLVLLSPRELEVMKLLAEGRTVPKCATELGLSRSTVDNHKWRIMKKLQIHKSSELTIRAIQEGLIHL
jgi:DNA-binding NarL/FixJ family response regulator